jgi:hypothetical protein
MDCPGGGGRNNVGLAAPEGIWGARLEVDACEGWPTGRMMWVSVSGRNSVGSSISGSESSTSSTRGWDIFKQEAGRIYEGPDILHENGALLAQQVEIK